MDKPIPGSGWNDPPPITIRVENCKTRKLLNKRVPSHFSNNDQIISSGTGSETSTTSNRFTQSPQSSMHYLNKTEMDQLELLQVKEILYKNAESIKNNNKKADVIKRLDIMCDMWLNNRFDIMIQQKIHQFAKCLDENKTEQANNIYSDLLLHSASLFNTWIIAFKYILYNNTSINQSNIHLE